MTACRHRRAVVRGTKVVGPTLFDCHPAQVVLPRALGPAPHGPGRTLGRRRGPRVHGVLPCPRKRRCLLHRLQGYSPQMMGPRGHHTKMASPLVFFGWVGGWGGMECPVKTFAAPSVTLFLWAFPIATGHCFLRTTCAAWSSVECKAVTDAPHSFFFCEVHGVRPRRAAH